MFPTKASIFVKQGNHEACAGIGQAAIIRNSEIGLATSKADNSIIALMLDPGVIHDERENLYKSVGQALPRTKNLAVLKSYVLWLHRNSASITSETASLFGQQLAELTKICGSKKDTSAKDENDLAGARLQLAINFIAQNYQDFALSEREVAAHQVISVRYLQKLFEKQGTSFIECLTEHRLQAARALLHSSRSERNVSEVALTVGYNDLSNFHRMFKRKFGETPTDARQRWLKEVM